eukprot:GAFH01003756.1.p4 GENE.GAFH01003756.1~~GAFH01003756.1.p4  ORF type:complete len:60 (+),score=1.94 GAFH01003756.1:382-561(+)
MLEHQKCDDNGGAPRLSGMAMDQDGLMRKSSSPNCFEALRQTGQNIRGWEIFDLAESHR